MMILEISGLFYLHSASKLNPLLEAGPVLTHSHPKQDIKNFNLRNFPMPLPGHSHHPEATFVMIPVIID